MKFYQRNICFWITFFQNFFYHLSARFKRNQWNFFIICAKVAPKLNHEFPSPRLREYFAHKSHKVSIFCKKREDVDSSCRISLPSPPIRELDWYEHPDPGGRRERHFDGAIQDGVASRKEGEKRKASRRISNFRLRGWARPEVLNFRCSLPV